MACSYPASLVRFGKLSVRLPNHRLADSAVSKTDQTDDQSYKHISEFISFCDVVKA
jgi:hypothetical protein